MMELSVAERLARVYREARVAVLDDRGSHANLVTRLGQEFDTVASYADRADAALSDWEAVYFERTRRAVILALRRQALAIRRQWIEREDRSHEAPATRAMESALALLDSASKLHRDGDRDATETAYVTAFIHRTLALGRRLPVAQTAAALPEAPIIAPAAALDPGDRTAPVELPRQVLGRPATAAVPEVPRPPTGARWPLLVSAAVTLAVIAGVVVTFVGTGRIVVRFPTATPAPYPSPVTRIVPTPGSTSVAVVTMLLQSIPSGASVVAGGLHRGTTPLRIEGKPGESLTVVVRRGNRIWRGVLQFGNEPEREITVALPITRSAGTPRSVLTPSSQDKRMRFEEAMREGIRLYEAGWYGPAIGRFKQAAALDPVSPRAPLWLGRALMKAGRNTEARRALERVLDLAQTSPQADEARVLLSRLR